MTDAVALDGVGKTVSAGSRRLPIVENVSLRVQAGEFVTFTGPSGSGKSTLLNLIGLLDRPTTGTISLFGRLTNSLSSAEMARTRANTLGFIFQSFQLIPHLTVEDNIALPLRYRTDPSDRRGVRALMERFDLLPLAGAFPPTLSGGEKQRTAIARALVNNPALVLADEPTGSLDSENSRRVIDFLVAIHQEGKTVLLVTHDPAIASRAQRSVTLQDGRVSGA